MYRTGYNLLAFFSSPKLIEQEKHPQLVNMEKADSVGVWAAMLYAFLIYISSLLK